MVLSNSSEQFLWARVFWACIFFLIMTNPFRTADMKIFLSKSLLCLDDEGFLDTFDRPQIE